MESKLLIVVVVAVLVMRLGAVWSRGKRGTHWWRRGMAALEREELDEAFRAFGKVVKLIPEAAPAHRMLGRVLVLRGEYEAAEEQLRFGAQLEPRNPEGHADLGIFLAVCPPERPEEAIDHLGKAVELAPELGKLLGRDARLAHLREYAAFESLVES